MKNNTKWTVGITGGIGSGKSYVCQLLSQRGIPVYNCDDQAKRLMVSSTPVRQALIQLIGPDTYHPDGTLNKPTIARYLFSDAVNAARVNAIVHPAVKQDFRQWADRQATPLLLMECAILFESGFDTLVDATVVVDAPHELRLQRAMERDHATREQIEARMRQQYTSAELCQRATHVIQNDGKTPLDAQLHDIFSPWIAKFY